MPSLQRPSAKAIAAFLAAQSRLELTSSAIEGTANLPPAGYVVDHTRIKLGEGEATFRAAKSALGRWDQLHLGWVETWPRGEPIETGRVVVVIARLLGLWWLNACRIVRLTDEQRPVRRFGFAYGTLPGHAGNGVERFLVEWDEASGEVWYDILAFSRPNQFLARLGYPYMRRVQKRFGRESAAAMMRAVRSETS